MKMFRLVEGGDTLRPGPMPPQHAGRHRAEPKPFAGLPGNLVSFLHPRTQLSRSLQGWVRIKSFLNNRVRQLVPRPWIPVLCLMAGLSLPHAGSGDWYRPLPGEVMGVDTVLVVHLRVQGFSKENLMATLQAILPVEILEQRDFSEALAGFEAELSAPLTRLGMEEVTWVFNAPRPGEFEFFVLLPDDPTSAPEIRELRPSGADALAASAELSVFALPGWIVLGKTAELPALAPALKIDDAGFAEAFSWAEDDADLAVAYVPSPDLRSRALGGFDAFLREQESPETRAFFGKLRPVLEPEWILATLKLGGEPWLRATLGMPTSGRAHHVSEHLAEFLSTARDLTQRASTADPDPEKHWDPAPLLKMYEALRPAEEGITSSIDLDRVHIRATIDGALFLVGLIASQVVQQVLLDPILDSLDPAPVPAEGQP